MGFEIFGKKPSTLEGEYFDNNNSWWGELVDYCIQVAPETCEKCKLWGTNDGDGLEEQDALALADRLQEEIDNGKCQAFAKEHNDRGPCIFCERIGVKKPGRCIGAGDEQSGITCFFCEGSGTTPLYAFSVDNIREFIAFLRGCGGFVIW